MQPSAQPGFSERAAIVRWHRADSEKRAKLDLSDAQVDAWLLQRFPGRTLDELDRMDWGRYLRAMEAGSISDLEARRDAQVAGHASLTDDEWERVREHDAMLEGDDVDGES